MFGFLKRRRAKAKPVRKRLASRAAKSTTTPPSQPPDEEPSGRSWFASSRDLHDGLVVREDDDVTLPSPIDPPEGETPPEGH